jgi:hypothetical protein
MGNSATDFENWRRKISYQTRNFRNGTRKISGNIDLGCAICKLSSLAFLNIEHVTRLIFEFAATIFALLR